MQERYFRREVNYRRVEEFWVRYEGDWVDREGLTVVDSPRPTDRKYRDLDVGRSSRALLPGDKSQLDGLQDDPTSE